MRRRPSARFQEERNSPVGEEGNPFIEQILREGKVIYESEPSGSPAVAVPGSV